MSIEFRCTQCGRILRVGDDAAGRQAQCPECKAIATVPSPGAQFSFQSPPMSPPAGSMPPMPPPSAGLNPYQSPYSPGGPGTMAASPQEYALGRVSGPATALIVAGALYLVGSLGALFIGIVAPLAEPGPGMPREQVVLGAAIWLVIGVVGLVLGVVILVGGVKMRRLRSYGLALTSAILALLPVTCCCMGGLPIGIWALVVLSDIHVRGAFARS